MLKCHTKITLMAMPINLVWYYFMYIGEVFGKVWKQYTCKSQLYMRSNMDVYYLTALIFMLFEDYKWNKQKNTLDACIIAFYYWWWCQYRFIMHDSILKINDFIAFCLIFGCLQKNCHLLNAKMSCRQDPTTCQSDNS